MSRYKRMGAYSEPFYLRLVCVYREVSRCRSFAKENSRGFPRRREMNPTEADGPCSSGARVGSCRRSESRRSRVSACSSWVGTTSIPFSSNLPFFKIFCKQVLSADCSSLFVSFRGNEHVYVSIDVKRFVSLKLPLVLNFSGVIKLVRSILSFVGCSFV